MDKLKTLKDIRFSEGKQENDIMFYDLKREAIKWVKKLFRFYHYDAAHTMVCFFNISEEDLK